MQFSRDANDFDWHVNEYSVLQRKWLSSHWTIYAFLLILGDTNSLHWHLDVECDASSLSSKSTSYFFVCFTIPPLFQSSDITQLLMPLMILPPFDVGSSYHCVARIILLRHTTLPCLIHNVTSLQNTQIFYHSSSRPIFGTYFHQVKSPLLTILTCLFSLPKIIAHFSIKNPFQWDCRTSEPFALPS